VPSTPDIGGPAPDFTLPGLQRVDGRIVRRDYVLSEERGHPVVLAFYPGDETSVCTKQMCSYSSGLEDFAALDAAVWGISPQGLDSHEHFAERFDLRLPLLADTEGTAVAAYGIGLRSSLRRAVFIVDAEGVIRWKHVALLGMTYRDTDTLKKQLTLLAKS
jgi:peroxiredoxin Q/BCP